MGTKRRLQLDFTEEAYDELKTIKAIAGAMTFSAVIRDALGCYKYIASQVVNGGKILVERKDEKGNTETREVIFQFIKIPEF